ncbi:LysR family transcriptional regulator [Thiothrix subterranea]|uniref:LysR family transcriptional regulator n=1 Tax=Thiothrix subterranea TaxID=2735563 RepID=A0AA51MPN9_9GAMM|nr:LysR family transcriptional regulator [Thiothrix subterranea]MDQ5768520.1 LysR family transcriptional regulator [Thiothrix subterranea]QQZ29086.1 LysR family transcriptional regulator [Thiothrix subterranea]WML87599.1 LysR family transcriptional regulator [Thiothrix subterranea]
MKDHDYLALDGYSMHVFLTVLEQGSLASAADKLGITKTVIGNCLTKLRSVFHDPLFVRTGGQEIVATARAESLGERMRLVLADMQQLTAEQVFKPKQTALHFTVGTNDFQRDLILPELYRQVASETKEFSLRTLISEYPSLELLRTGKADLLLSPVAPEGTDILYKRLFIDQPRCFFDGNARQAPRTLADFRNARYVGLNLVDGQRVVPLAAPIARELEQQVAIRVPNFSDMASFMRGSDLLAIAPGMLRMGALSGFSSSIPPFNLPSVFMFMLWHKRHQGDPAHQWVRNQLEAAVSGVMERVKLAKA